MNINATTISFSEAYDKVMAITDSKATETITADNYHTLPEIEDYSDHGFAALGRTVGFPAPFVMKVAATNPTLAKTIVDDRTRNYFGGDKPNDNKFCLRSFLGRVCGVVSSKYSVFDDDEVMDIIAGSPLADMALQNSIITPERLHLRAIDKSNPFKVNGDDSEHYFAYFIDNSMVGMSSFRVCVGVYRLACTNGLIVPTQEFVMCKQKHIGKKDIAAEFNANIELLSEKQTSIREMLSNLALEKATIADMMGDMQTAYLSKKLNLSNKESERVLELYHTEYDGRSKWGMVNAITQFARDINDITRREYLESRAIKVA